ncbi:MAG: hypothetical protein IKJ29_07335, partial [Akkermansia sp.]|nr:hypothetical protein [Akkermansia sp.]
MAYADEITNACLLPMARRVIPYYEFSHRTLCPYIVQGYFSIIFGTRVAIACAVTGALRLAFCHQENTPAGVSLHDLLMRQLKID